MLLLENFKLLIALLTLGCSMITTFVVMPRIIKICLEKNLTATTNGRTSHIGVVPNLGGIAVFIGLLLSINIVYVLFGNHQELIDLIVFNILVSLLFLVGVLDDLVNISPWKKLFFQLITALVFALGTSTYIVSFAGLLGLNGLGYVTGIVFSVFVITVITNAYNLIDGIDGLAGSIGVFIAGVMALVFFISGYFLYSVISMALVGSLLAFLIYNFSQNRKIFLGDAGSLVVGFVLATQVVLYLNLSTANASPLFKNAPLFVLALLSYPLLDTLRVFVVRIKNGTSPFRADRNHIHHRLLDLGLSHKYATLYVVIYTFAVVILAYLLNDLPINLAFAILLPASLGLLGLPFVVKRKRKYPGFEFDWSWERAEQ